MTVMATFCIEQQQEDINVSTTVLFSWAISKERPFGIVRFFGLSCVIDTNNRLH